ncbi:HAD-like domain-containing protein [Hyaloraphidium curvatum]|nr:HAD-like domain-containing protein [Hyaloraphidium curvatum]
MSVGQILLFDLDGTLYHHSTGYEAFVLRRIYDFMVERLGVERERVVAEQQRLFSIFGQTQRGLRSPVSAGGLGRTDFDLQEYWDFIRGTPEEQARFLKRDPGVEKLLRSLREAGSTRGMYVFTNADETNARVALDCILGPGMADRLFDGVFGAFFLGDQVAKPAKEAFEKVFKKIGLAVGDDEGSTGARWRCIFFEDSPTNLKAAKQLGLRTVWVTGGRHLALLGDSENGPHPALAPHVSPAKITQDEERMLRARFPFADHIIDACDYETVHELLPDLFGRKETIQEKNE